MVFNIFQKSVKNVLKAGHPILRSKAQPVTNYDSVKQITAEMSQIFNYKKNTVLGLAAPQLGYSLRIIGYKSEGELKFIVNPKIEYLGPLVAEYESCISIPSYSALVKRNLKVKVEGHCVDGEVLKFEVSGLVARVIQHEYDHLDGILITDKMEPKSLRHDDYIDQYELVK